MYNLHLLLLTNLHLIHLATADVLLPQVGHQICNLQVVCSIPGWAPLSSGLGQATYTCVPLSPTSIIWYWSRGDLFGRESNRGPGGK